MSSAVPVDSISAKTAIEMLRPGRNASSRRVLAWRDVGAYLSIDVGTDAGIELHLNLPDTGERVAEDVEAMPDGSMLAISGGVFTVPLYTLLQGRSEPSTRSRVVAANNVLNAVFMVGGSVFPAPVCG